MQVDYTREPLLGSEIAGFVFGVLSLLFMLIWRRDRERGLLWLSVAYALITVQCFINRYTIPNSTAIHPLASAVVGTAAAAFGAGVVQYLLPASACSRRLLAWATLPPLLLPLAAIVGIVITRPWGHLPYAVGVAAITYAATQAARIEPSAQHEWLIAGLLSMPGFVLVVSLLGVDSFYLRYYMLLPGMLFGFLLLTVSLLRRRRALEQENLRRIEAERALTALNASLEATVAQRTSELQDLVAGLESFNRNVSHDLHGSLGGMAGLARAAESALRDRDTPVAERVLPLIATQAEHTASLVDGLLSLARVGDREVRRTTVSLAAMTREAFDLACAANADLPRPQLVVGDLPALTTDAALLRVTLVNLLGNAVKFCGYRPDACVEVHAASDGREVVIEVRDNGVGFQRDRATALFEPFARLHGRDFAGHGLGLSIVRRAMERLGGRVWADAAPDQGARFYFSLPCNVGATGAEKSAAALSGGALQQSL